MAGEALVVDAFKEKSSMVPGDGWQKWCLVAHFKNKIILGHMPWARTACRGYSNKNFLRITLWGTWAEPMVHMILDNKNYEALA